MMCHSNLQLLTFLASLLAHASTTTEPLESVYQDLLIKATGTHETRTVPADEAWLPNWMGLTMAAIENQTLSDLSLPGTHDSITYDLSTVISDGGIDDYPELSELIHDFGNLDPAGKFLKSQAQTHTANITQQLDGGIRFIDFRIMYESGSKDWRCLHCVQSNQPSLTYLRAVRTWLDQHPSEVVVMWLSKHGNEVATGNEQYPNVSVEEKQGLWQAMVAVFKGVLFDTSVSNNETPLSTLVARNHRLVLYCSDYVQFTNSSQYALDGALIDNYSRGAIDREGTAVEQQMQDFKNASARKAADRTAGKFYLYSLANSPPLETISDSTKLHFVSPEVLDVMGTRRDCASHFNIPNMTTWCPTRLIDVSQLSNYYAQLPIAAALTNNAWDLPNAIYIDAVDAGGTIRTGTRPLSADDSPTCDVFKFTSCQTHQPSCDEGWTANGDTEHWQAYDSDGSEHGFCGLAWQDHYKCCRNAVDGRDTARFAYVDTFIAVNLRRACALSSSSQCDVLKQIAQQRIEAHPLKVWADPDTGRHAEWQAVRSIKFNYH